MSSSRRQFLRHTAMLVAGAGVARDGVAQIASGREEAAIREVLTAYEQARGSGDRLAGIRFYAPHADFDSAAGSYAEGLEQILSALTSAPRATSDVTLTVARVRFIRPDVAVADAAYCYAAQDGDTRTAARALFVMSRNNGQWLIASARVFPKESDRT